MNSRLGFRQKNKNKKKKFLHPWFIADAIHKKRKRTKTGKK